MSAIDDLMNERGKRDALVATGMNPYTATAKATHTNGVVLERLVNWLLRANQSH